MQLICKNVEELPQIAKQFWEEWEKHKTFIFKGDLGAGKTAFIKALCKHLKVKDDVSSPTYSIVNEYEFGEGVIYHFDLYRVNNIEELHEIGFWEYLDSNQLVFIEWPEIVEDFLENYIEVLVIVAAGNSRVYNITNS